MRCLFFLFLFFIEILCALAQKEFKVSIIDKEKNEPVSFATLLYFYSGKCSGAYSDAKGIISVDLPDNIDSFRISCLGYKLVTRQHLQNSETIELNVESYVLPEILIMPYNKNKLRSIGFANMKSKCNIGAYSGVECAVLIRNEAKKEQYIKSILYNIKIHENDPFVFRVHLYLCDSLNMPGKELINKNTTVTLSKKRAGLVEVDISSQLIKIPTNGIFVGMEWIGRLDETANHIKYFDGKPQPNNLSLGASIEFVEAGDKHLTYLRSINENKNWGNDVLSKVIRFENSTLNAAFGIKLFNN